ncbi:type III PLP-dependent enzyme [Candidatus Gracilibacteria bacterium]|nr:type III PLP-dependent enzyme [Candidatus Gracilibacteria bacterium]
MTPSEPGAGCPQVALSDFLTEAEISTLKSVEQNYAKPTLYLFRHRIRDNYRKLKSLYPDTEIFYAVKACPHPKILETLIAEGSCFDVASIYELDRVLSLGCTPDRVSYGNTIKKEKDIAHAFAQGIRMFSTDSDEDVEKLARNAPGSRVYFRILTPTFAADWPLSKKFGAEKHVAIRLAEKARDLGLVPYGVSFHVGSQQKATEAWDAALDGAKTIFDILSEKGIHLEMVNLGGGLPTPYITPIPTDTEYQKSIHESMHRYFGNRKVRFLQEPGRSLAGNIGVIVSEVVLVSKKSDLPHEPRWVYIDLGLFSGLPETLDEAIKYPLVTSKDGETAPVIMAGPTCDSADILYEDFRYDLPLSLTSGDSIYILSTGAYTQSYSAIEFNGFPPLQAVVLEDGIDNNEKTL